MSRTARLIAAAGLTALLSCTAAVTTGPEIIGWDSVQAATAPGIIGWDSVRAASPLAVGVGSATTDKRIIGWD
ncbi:hypothetical protein [Streptomyces racemochromogenes]|uniref:hypothetical protein n=1 Tax=Streptomyces racemochromogenes TaxID=67353 RepID=UPI0031E9B744